MDNVIQQYFWIRKNNPGIPPALAWADAMSVVQFFLEELKCIIPRGASKT